MCGEHLVEERQVVEAAKVDRAKQPDGVRVVRRGLEGIGEGVHGKCHVGPRRAHYAGGQLPAGEIAKCIVGDLLRLGRVRAQIADGLVQAIQQRLDPLRMCAQEAGPGDEVGGVELALRPQVPLVDKHGSIAFDDQAARPWLRHPRAVDLALLECGQRLRVVLRKDAHVTAAGGVGLEAVVLEKPSQGDVLRAPELWVGDLLALQRRDGADAGPDDQLCTTRGRARDDSDRLAVRLRERVDRRVRPDEGDVDRAGEDGGDGVAAGVERMSFELYVGAERGREQALLEPDQRRCMSQVREVSQPDRQRPGVWPRRGGVDDQPARDQEKRRCHDRGEPHLAPLQCRPHSLTPPCSHHHRPARSSSPAVVARVHGAQPIEV